MLTMSRRGNKNLIEDECCVICMSEFSDKKTLAKCGHSFCRSCIDDCFAKMTPRCPICWTIYGRITGNQPETGTMSTRVCRNTRLPGFEKYGTIVITYSFPSGTQTSKHPKPGHQYHGTSRTAYLPDSLEGQKVCRLLKKAFDARVVFTVGRSATTGLDDRVTWNDIHHKTNTYGGPTCFGYPDPTYLNRVQQELAAWGFVE